MLGISSLSFFSSAAITSFNAKSLLLMSTEFIVDGSYGSTSGQHSTPKMHRFSNCS